MIPRVQAVVEAVTEERHRFERFCRALTDKELTRLIPGSEWTVHDFISHVVTLDQAYAGWFAELAGTSVTGTHRGTVGFDVDEFNQHEVAERRNRSVEALLAEGAETRAAVIAELSRLTDDQLAATIRFGGDRKRSPVHLPLAEFLPGWARHDAIHVADMLRALPERRDDLEIRAWLNDPELAASIARYQQAMG